MSQSWLRNEIFSGIRDRDMKIPKKSRVQNIGDMKTPKDAEWKLPKIPKSRGSGFIFSRYPEIPKRWRFNAFKFPGFGILIPGIWDHS